MLVWRCCLWTCNAMFFSEAAAQDSCGRWNQTRKEGSLILMEKPQLCVENLPLSSMWIKRLLKSFYGMSKADQLEYMTLHNRFNRFIFFTEILWFWSHLNLIFHFIKKFLKNFNQKNSLQLCTHENPKIGPKKTQIFIFFNF